MVRDIGYVDRWAVLNVINGIDGAVNDELSALLQVAGSIPACNKYLHGGVLSTFMCVFS